MKLVKVETKGFKSFADKVVLRFDGGVVGIIGPNGSGKSNINDAIKWVLGERSMKALRGSTANDIIFAGSKTTPPAKRAEVSLTFDNSNGSLPNKPATFTVTRAIERDSGDNQYFINGEVAKLKEIEEIAIESGISKSSLAIISQGTIQNIAQALPEDRRGLFEEVAGVAKYRLRKEEATKKLERTTVALEKIRAITVELDKQLIPLKKQAEKAKIWLQKKEELKDIEVGLIVEDVQFYSAQLETLNKMLAGVIEEKDNLNFKITSVEQDIKSKNSTKGELEVEIQKLQQDVEDITEKLVSFEIASNAAQQRRQMILDGTIEATNKAKEEATAEELEELSQKLRIFADIENKSISEIETAKEFIADRQKELQKVNQLLDASHRELVHIRSRISILKEQEETKSNLFKGTKVILENTKSFPGVKGLVAQLINVDEKYVPAIELALSKTLQNLVVDNSETALKAVNFLKQNHLGRSTFIPLNIIKPRTIPDEHLSILATQEGFLGIAADLVESDVKYEILKKYLLGNIIITREVEHAQEIARLLRYQYICVSLDGDIVRPGGILTGGEREKGKDLLNQGAKIISLQETIPAKEAIIHSEQEQANRLNSEISLKQSEINELNIELAKIKQKKEIIESQYNTLKTQYEVDSQKTFVASDAEIEVVSKDVLDAERSKLRGSIASKRETVTALANDLTHLANEKVQLEQTLRKITEESATSLSEKNNAEFVVRNASERLADEYEMTLEVAAENFSLSMARDAAREIVAKIKSEIKELGSVNLEAIASYEEIATRHEKLMQNEEEIFNAQQIITSAIAEMDHVIVTRLNETVRAVNGEMETIFKKLFGGGFAELKYTQPNNLLETGIDVIAQPPGKTVKNLNLFSGGEKAMIAISLLFAILKARPLPLCILDEVEAALDDANVIRFANYLQELKNQTQFVVITHRVGTMSRVDYLFGATMQTKGVTSFFTIKLTDATKLLESEAK